MCISVFKGFDLCVVYMRLLMHVCVCVHMLVSVCVCAVSKNACLSRFIHVRTCMRPCLYMPCMHIKCIVNIVKLYACIALRVYVCKCLRVYLPAETAN